MTPRTLYEGAAGVVVAMGLATDWPVVPLFFGLSLLVGPKPWPWWAAASAAMALEAAARLLGPTSADRAALGRAATEMWGLASLVVAFGGVVGGGGWWLGPGRLAARDGRAAAGAVVRIAAARVARVVLGLLLVYG